MSVYLPLRTILLGRNRNDCLSNKSLLFFRSWNILFTLLSWIRGPRDQSTRPAAVQGKALILFFFVRCLLFKLWNFASNATAQQTQTNWDREAGHLKNNEHSYTPNQHARRSGTTPVPDRLWLWRSEVRSYCQVTRMDGFLRCCLQVHEQGE